MRSLACFSSGCCFLPSVKESQSSVCWSAESCQLLPCDQESVLVQCFWKSEWLILFMLFNVISNKKAVRFRFFLLLVFFFHPCETKSLTYLVYLHYFVCHRISEANCDVGFQTPRAECCALGGLAGLELWAQGSQPATRPSRLCCSTVLLRNGSRSHCEMARQKEKRKHRIDFIFMQLYSLAHTGGSVSINGNF